MHSEKERKNHHNKSQSKLTIDQYILHNERDQYNQDKLYNVS